MYNHYGNHIFPKYSSSNNKGTFRQLEHGRLPKRVLMCRPFEFFSLLWSCLVMPAFVQPTSVFVHIGQHVEMCVAMSVFQSVYVVCISFNQSVSVNGAGALRIVNQLLKSFIVVVSM